MNIIRIAAGKETEGSAPQTRGNATKEPRPKQDIVNRSLGHDATAVTVNLGILTSFMFKPASIVLRFRDATTGRTNVKLSELHDSLSSYLARAFSIIEMSPQLQMRLIGIS